MDRCPKITVDTNVRSFFSVRGEFRPSLTETDRIDQLGQRVRSSISIPLRSEVKDVRLSYDGVANVLQVIFRMANVICSLHAHRTHERPTERSQVDDYYDSLRS